jgi:membrane protein DedA with SNARE-associated domain
MAEEVVSYITRYGYMAIFVMIFLQETGMPNPFPNELLLLFSGYLSYKGLLTLPIIIITAVSADFLGTNVLYILFYYAGSYIISKKPRWVPLSEKTLTRLRTRISENGKSSIFLFRLTPFTRGYVSVVAGLLLIKPRIYMPLALLSGLVWSTFYIVTGRLIGSSWSLFVENAGIFKYIMLLILAGIIIIFLISFYRNRKKNRRTSEMENKI